jgi:hypothetical protein
VYCAMRRGRISDYPSCLKLRLSSCVSPSTAASRGYMALTCNGKVIALVRVIRSGDKATAIAQGRARPMVVGEFCQSRYNSIQAHELATS